MSIRGDYGYSSWFAFTFIYSQKNRNFDFLILNFKLFNSFSSLNWSQLTGVWISLTHLPSPFLLCFKSKSIVKRVNQTAFRSSNFLTKIEMLNIYCWICSNVFLKTEFNTWFSTLRFRPSEPRDLLDLNNIASYDSSNFYILIWLVCLSVCLFVCLYPINVKTAKPFWPKFCIVHHMTPG